MYRVILGSRVRGIDVGDQDLVVECYIDRLFDALSYRGTS